MKVSCYKSDLVDALKLVGKAVAVKPSTPILSGIYLATNDNRLELQSNNFTTGIIARIPVNVEREGAIVTVGKKFIDIVSKLPDETLTLEVEDNELIITSGGAKFSLLTFNAEDYPQVQKPDGTEFNFAADTLKEIIGKTSNTVTKDDTRPIFTGILFEVEGNEIKATSTDTHRLSHYAAQVHFNSGGAFKVNIPAVTLKVMLPILPSDAQDVKITVGEKVVAFQFENYLMTTRLLSSEFPPYNKVLETEEKFSVTVKRKELKQAVERVSLVAKDSTFNTLILEIENGTLKVCAKSESSKAEEFVEIEGGAELKIGFNFLYVIDCLNTFDGETIQIEFNDAYTPSKWREVGNEKFVGIITPVRF